MKCPTCQIGEIVEKNGKFGKFFCCTNFPNCKTVCKSIAGKPDLAYLESKTTPAIFTLNDEEIKKVLMIVALNAYPSYQIPDFTIILYQKDRASIHGRWFYPKPGTISKIEIFNLYRKYEHTLSTSIHELAHHCHYMLEGRTNHKKEFYEVLKHLLEVAHKLGFINLVQTYDMIDNADRRQLVKYFGPPLVQNNQKISIDLLKINCTAGNPMLSKRGYIYSQKEKKWIYSLLNKSMSEELDWLEKNVPNCAIEIANNITNQVDSVFFCIIGHFHIIHPDELLSNGFYNDDTNGWMKKVPINQKKELEIYLSKYKVTPKYYTYLPKTNSNVKAIKNLPMLGQETGKQCPLCGSELITNDTKFGIFENCSKFLIGCRYARKI